MGCEISLNKAWEELENLSRAESLEVRFLNDVYTLEVRKRLVLSNSCNVAAKDYLTVLILHYQLRKLEGIFNPSGEWCSFKDIPGGEIYYPAFRKRAIEPILRKYGENPEGILLNIGRLGARRIEEATASLFLEAFENVPLLIKIWQGDEEFSAEADVLFDKYISEIFCTEDIVVLAGTVAAAL